MTNEKYVFLQDVKDKKRTAKGSHNKRTHAGKGGAVKFPSDYMSKKEIKKMNGECKVYYLGKPISYEEYRQMPEDIKKQYIQGLISKFDMSNKALAEMLGCSVESIRNVMRKFGIERVQRRNLIEYKLKDEAFEKWWKTYDAPSEEPVVDAVPVSAENEEQEDTKVNAAPSDDLVSAFRHCLCNLICEEKKDDEVNIAPSDELVSICEGQEDNKINVRPVNGSVSIYEDSIVPESLSMTLQGSPWQIYKTLEAIYGKNKIKVEIDVYGKLEA